MPADAKLDKVQRDEPFFRFYYVSGPSRYQVEFTFDLVARRINVRSIQIQTVSQEVRVVQEPEVKFTQNVTAKNFPLPSSASTISVISSSPKVRVQNYQTFGVQIS